MNIKDTIKKKLNFGSRIDADALYARIQSTEYVSFDVFDTLIKRNVAEPTDIFSIMEILVGDGFKAKRINAEKKARAELGKREITIDDIYYYFPEEDRKRLISMELDTEFNAIVPNQEIAEIYRRCIKAGKTIFITSDMYWPEAAVVQLLKKNGYDKYKALYLSSSEQKVKSDGSLFKCLLERERIDPERLFHIGDSPKSDYDEPKKLGIKAIRIPRYFKNIEFRDDESEKIRLNYLNHFINNTFPYTEDSYFQLGYSQFGKLLFGYVHWIHTEAIKRKIKRIFFFARDGFLMKQAYETCIDDQSIETIYLEVSRRSLRGPVLWMDPSYETILNMVINTKLISLESIFDGLGLEISNYKEQIKLHGFKLSTSFNKSSIFANEQLKKLIADIQPDIVENSKKEYELLKEYLQEKGVCGKFAVVDIGYGGSMQRYLQQMLTKLGINHDITGFYLAVADFYKKNMLPGIKLDLNGYLFDFQHDQNAIDTRSSFVGLFETLFLEQGGSVKKYVFDNDKIVVERYPYEYEVAGQPTEDLIKIRKIQHGAIDFINRASKNTLIERLKCEPSEYFSGIYRIGTNPTLVELNLLGDISFYDEGEIHKLAAPDSIMKYILHPKSLKEDFLHCRWKTGFMKRLIKIKLPYQSIYKLLKRI